MKWAAWDSVVGGGSGGCWWRGAGVKGGEAAHTFRVPDTTGAN